MIITVSGFIGSGKTTVAKALAKRYNLRHISAGDVFRELAKKKELSLQEFSSLAETNPDIDREVDNLQRQKISGGDVVAEGRLSGWLLDADFKIWLEASLETRARRVAKRESKSYEVAFKETRDREESEMKRYREIYGIDLRELSPYSIVVDTEDWGAEEVVNLIIEVISTFWSGVEKWIEESS
jgi:cytidylate kinase